MDIVDVIIFIFVISLVVGVAGALGYFAYTDHTTKLRSLQNDADGLVGTALALDTNMEINKTKLEKNNEELLVTKQLAAVNTIQLTTLNEQIKNKVKTTDFDVLKKEVTDSLSNKEVTVDNTGMLKMCDASGENCQTTPLDLKQYIQDMIDTSTGVLARNIAMSAELKSTALISMGNAPPGERKAVIYMFPTN
jgi:hypothetical protein